MKQTVLRVLFVIVVASIIASSGFVGIGSAQDTAPTCSEVSFSGGDGSESAPYKIENVSQLQCVNQDLNAHYELITDVDASATSGWNGASGFKPVGSPTTSFSGSFNGNGSTISGLTIDRAQADAVGLFGFVGTDGEVVNATLEAAEVTGNNKVGSLIGSNSGLVINATANGTVSGTSYIGGLTGYSTGELTNVTASGDVSGSKFNVGGLVGENTATVTNATASGNATGYGDIGGLIGDNSGSVTNATASGNATGYGDIGGLIGDNSGLVTTATAYGTVSASASSTEDDIGGLIGYNTEAVTDVSAFGDVSGQDDDVGGLLGDNSAPVMNAMASGNVSANDNDAGGLIGENGGAVTNAMASGNVTGDDEVGGLIGDCSGPVTNATVFVNVTADTKVGGLVGQTAAGVSITDASVSGSVAGEQYLGGAIGFHQGADVVRAHSNATVTQQDTGDSNEYVGGLIGDNSGGAVIGSRASGDVSVYTSYGGGLIGFQDGDDVRNSSAHGNVTEVTQNSVGYIGGLIGSSASGNITNATATGNISAKDPVSGGLIGLSSAGVVKNSSATGNVTSGSTEFAGAGGLIGRVSGTKTILNSHATGNVHAQSWDTGGLIGYMESANIINSSATGNVHTDSYDVGGLIGYNDGGGDIRHSFAHGDISTTNENWAYAGGLVGDNSGGHITNSSATGNVTANGNYVGGLLGLHAGRNLSNVTASGPVSGASNVGGLAGKIESNADSVIRNASATGNVTARGSKIGGFVGVSASGSGAIINSIARGDVNVTKGSAGVVGGFIGKNQFASLRNVSASGGVHALNADAVGGLVGQHSGKNITAATATGHVYGKNDIGGLIGDLGSAPEMISDASATGDVTGTANRVGGVVGNHTGKTQWVSIRATGNATGVKEVGGFLGGGSGAPIVYNASSNGDVKGTKYVGGFAGNLSTNVTLVNITATGDVTSTATTGNSYAGGLIGNVRDGTLSAAAATGNVSAAGDSVGGLAGTLGTNSEHFDSVRVNESYATGDVTGNRSVGGLVGKAIQTNITDAYATGSVDGTAALGGLIGTHTGTNASVAEVYAAGVVSDGGGGLIGSTHGSPTVNDAYWDTARTTRGSSAGSASNLTTEAMTGGDALADGNMDGFDEQTWQPVTAETPGADRDSYPVLRSLPLTPQLLFVTSDTDPGSDSGSDTETGPSESAPANPVAPSLTTRPQDTDDDDDDNDNDRRAHNDGPDPTTTDDTPTTRVSLLSVLGQPELTTSRPETTPEDDAETTSDDTMEATPDDLADGTDDGDTLNSPTPDVSVRVENPQSGQTLVISNDHVQVVADSSVIENVSNPVTEPDSDEASPPPSEETDPSGDTSRLTGANGDTSVSNVRADRMTVELDTDRDFSLSVTTYESDLTPSTTIYNGPSGTTDPAAAVRGDEPSLQAINSTVRASGFALTGVVTPPTQADPPSAPREVTTAAESFERTTNTVAAGYVNVEHTLAPDELRGATLEFRIRRAYLTQLGVDPDRVTLYHRASNGTWTVRNTTHIGSDATYHWYEGSMPGFSVFALGTGAPRVSLAEASLTSQSVRLGEPVTATATLVNRGQTSSETTINLTRDGVVLDQATVTTLAETTHVVRLAHTPESRGSITLSVGPKTIGTVTVERPPSLAVDGTSPTTTDETSPTTTDETSTTAPGVGMLFIVLLVTLVSGLWARRRAEKAASADASPTVASDADVIEATSVSVDDADVSPERDMTDSEPPHATDAPKKTDMDDPSAESMDTRSEDASASEAEDASASEAEEPSEDG